MQESTAAEVRPAQDVPRVPKMIGDLEAVSRSEIHTLTTKAGMTFTMYRVLELGELEDISSGDMVKLRETFEKIIFAWDATNRKGEPIEPTAKGMIGLPLDVVAGITEAMLEAEKPKKES